MASADTDTLGNATLGSGQLSADNPNRSAVDAAARMAGSGKSMVLWLYFSGSLDAGQPALMIPGMAVINASTVSYSWVNGGDGIESHWDAIAELLREESGPAGSSVSWILEQLASHPSLTIGPVTVPWSAPPTVGSGGSVSIKGPDIKLPDVDLKPIAIAVGVIVLASVIISGR